jgi:CheY-like chemotaxis protein/Tfp pilus assembly protein PilZ
MIDAAADKNDRSNRYLLVVDNNTSDLFIASMLLQRFKYQVCTANTAGQSLEMMSIARPALVMAELLLPGMSGLDLFKIMKQDPRTSSIPFIFLYNSADDTEQRRSMTSGADGYLLKPIIVEDLYRIVQAAVETTPRANIRIQASLDVRVNSEMLDHVEGDCASVLSEHGMYVRTHKPYQKNERVTMQVNLNGRSIGLEATVLYCHTYGNGPFKEPGMGLTFSRIDSADRDYIRKFIREEVTKGINTKRSG